MTSLSNIQGSTANYYRTEGCGDVRKGRRGEWEMGRWGERVRLKVEG
jgi:hypothetical protein